MKRAALVMFLLGIVFSSRAQKAPVDYVNPFIGTTNYGTTNPGAVCPNGMMSVVPFNVMGSAENTYDKDARWWSTPYEYFNVFFTGFSHVNLSGVGCPELGSLLLMPTAGELNVDYHEYGSRYCDEKAEPGYYSNFLTHYGITAEATASPRVGVSRFTFPAGESHILLNLGEGLTNESGAMLRRVNDCEFEGMKLLGTFCYNPQAVFPIYFVMRVDKQPVSTGYWKRQRLMTGVEAEWDPDNGRYKLYTKYGREIAGDDIGAFLDFETQEGERIEVQIAVSFTSIENARLNLEAELSGKDFDTVRAEARDRWNDDLSRILVEGGTEDRKTVFYTALYHTLIHPNILQDVNGDYPEMEGARILNTKASAGNNAPDPTGDGDMNTVSESPDWNETPVPDRYTVFSLWDTYRNVHQLLALVYPERQTAMVRSMLDMYREWGWLPKWELYGRETLTMEGDPAIPVIVDTWLKGLRDFDIDLAYEAMRKGAFTPGAENVLRPDNDDYTGLGYVPLRGRNDNSVSHALEYYIADNALSRLASALGKDGDAEILHRRALEYRHYYSEEYGTFRPLLPDGTFYSPFDPKQGANFEENPGFHEGCAWNYTFCVPHDVPGLAKLMGGDEAFVKKLQYVFDEGLYDPANEPDIAYPHLFSYFKGEEWRTQQQTRRLLNEYFKNAPDGIPGNDDTGTMSAWAVFNMIGLYPDCPGDPYYTLTAPVFDKVTIRLDPAVYGRDSLVIETLHPAADGSSVEDNVVSVNPDNSSNEAAREQTAADASSSETAMEQTVTDGSAEEDTFYIKSMELGGKKLDTYRISHSDLISAGNLKFILGK